MTEEKIKIVLAQNSQQEVKELLAFLDTLSQEEKRKLGAFIQDAKRMKNFDVNMGNIKELHDE